MPRPTENPIHIPKILRVSLAIGSIGRGGGRGAIFYQLLLAYYIENVFYFDDDRCFSQKNVRQQFIRRHHGISAFD
jgi:hypothetical protein